MACINPGHRWVVNPLTGGRTWMPFPCGKCINCLHAFQDSWAIRINESCKRSPGHKFIYDTLTIRPESMPVVAYDDVELSSLPDDVRKLLRGFSSQQLHLTGEYLSCVVPFVQRSLIRDWIRRARELYYYNTGVRPHWKYFIVMEYGPRTSRPHFHGVFMGISKADYIQYLAVPWRKLYGFTKTKEVCNDTPKGRQCISRYVSKYCSKGVFESPLVKVGLCPKPFRCISHGIGAEYLDLPKFDWSRTPMVKALKSICTKPFVGGPNGEYSGGVDYSELVSLFRSDVSEFHHLPNDSQLADLVQYVDESSFVHAAPRYFKSKLLNSSKPNYYACEVQSLLSAGYQQYYQKCLFEFALSAGVRYAEEDSPNLGLSSELFDSIGRLFAFEQRKKALIEAKRRFTSLKNLYIRPLNNRALSFLT